MAIEYTCTHRYLSVWVHTLIDTCVRNAAMGPYIMHAYECIIDVYRSIYTNIHAYRIHIYMHTDARPSMPSHRCTHAYKSIHARMHEGMAAAERRWSRRCACACAHVGIRTRLDARASIQTHVVQMGITHPRAHTRTRTRTSSRRHGFYICTHTYTYVLTRRHTHIYMYIVTHSWRSQPRVASPLPPRAQTRAHGRTRLHGIYTHTHMHVHALTRRRAHVHMYIVTHIWRSRARIAPPLPLRARTRTRTHAQARAHTHARMHATSARIHPHMRAYICRYICP